MQIENWHHQWVTPQTNSAAAVQDVKQAVRRDPSGLVLRTVATTK